MRICCLYELRRHFSLRPRDVDNLLCDKNAFSHYARLIFAVASLYWLYGRNVTDLTELAVLQYEVVLNVDGTY